MTKTLKHTLMLFVSPLVLTAGIDASVLPHRAAFAVEQQEHKEDQAGGHGDEHGEENVVEMDRDARQKAGVITSVVAMQNLVGQISAPGEVSVNLYATTQVTPRIAAQVIARHARMGNAVKNGQPLVTLSSVEMAEAQGNLLLAEREWSRTKRLGKDIVSEQQYLQAQIGAQLAKAKVLAYGMAQSQLDTLLANGSAAAGTGQFDLVATQAGTVIRDDFIVGQFVEPGQALFAISDESSVWVEAQMSPEKVAQVKLGTEAWIIDDGTRVPGKVVQIHHTVDPQTRTLAVRVQVDNRDDALHAGEFVDVLFTGSEGHAVTAVPNEALVLFEGQTVVFKVEGDELHPTAVEVGPSKGGWTEVKSGLFVGDEIVTAQAFLIKSLILKTKMGTGHGH